MTKTLKDREYKFTKTKSKTWMDKEKQIHKLKTYLNKYRNLFVIELVNNNSSS